MRFIAMLFRSHPVLSGMALAVVAVAIGTAVTAPLRSHTDSERISQVFQSPCLVPDVIGFAGGAELMTLPDTVLDRELEAMREMGATWIRIGVEWNKVESSRGDLDWSEPDRIVNRARGQGFRVLGVVLGTPAWARMPGARNSLHALPADPVQFGRFAGEVAAHYENQIDTWEIWNEPNIITFARPRPDVVHYHAMLVAAAQQIRSRTSQDTRIVSGGLAPAGDDGVNIAPVTFLNVLYSLGETTAWDIVGMHPYTYPAAPDDNSTLSWNAYLRMDLMRDTMRRNGDGSKPIWITEFGAPTGGDPGRDVSPQEQARALVTVISDAAADPLLGPVFIHSPRDRGTDPNDVEDHFGLLYQDFTPKPAYPAIQELAGCRDVDETTAQVAAPTATDQRKTG